MSQLKASSLMAAVVAFAALGAQAEVTATTTTTDAAKTSIKIEDVKADKNKVEGDIDQEITNARMRADAGSKSKWSVSGSMNYLGGTLRNPMDKNRANPTNEPVAERVNLSGDIGIRYRLDKAFSLKAGTGVSLERPFQEAKRGNISNPSLSLDAAYKTGDIQNSTSLSVTYITNSNERDNGQVAAVGLSQVAVTDFKGSRFSLGLAADVIYYTFDKSIPTQQADYILAAYPFAEYAISDMFQIRTVTRPWIYRHIRAEDQPFDMAKAPWTQSLGLTIVASRDVYFYPNFQWDMEKWRESDYNLFRDPVVGTTTVGVSGTFSIF